MILERINVRSALRKRRMDRKVKIFKSVVHTNSGETIFTANKKTTINGRKFKLNYFGDGIKIPRNTRATLYAAMHPQASRVGDFIFCCGTQANAEASVTRLLKAIKEDITESAHDESDGYKVSNYSFWEIRRVPRGELKKLLEIEKMYNPKKKKKTP
jgi:hypothetical protein